MWLAGLAAGESWRKFIRPGFAKPRCDQSAALRRYQGHASAGFRTKKKPRKRGFSCINATHWHWQGLLWVERGHSPLAYKLGWPQYGWSAIPLFQHALAPSKNRRDKLSRGCARPTRLGIPAVAESRRLRHEQKAARRRPERCSSKRGKLARKG